MNSLTHIHTANLDDVSFRFLVAFEPEGEPQMFLASNDLRSAANTPHFETEAVDGATLDAILTGHERSYAVNGNDQPAISLEALFVVLDDPQVSHWISGDTQLCLCEEINRASDKAAGYRQRMNETSAH